MTQNTHTIHCCMSNSATTTFRFERKKYNELRLWMECLIWEIEMNNKILWTNLRFVSDPTQWKFSNFSTVSFFPIKGWLTDWLAGRYFSLFLLHSTPFSFVSTQQWSTVATSSSSPIFVLLKVATSNQNWQWIHFSNESYTWIFYTIKFNYSCIASLLLLLLLFRFA